MNDGPLWTRFYNEKPEEEVCEELEKVLKVTKVSIYKKINKKIK